MPKAVLSYTKGHPDKICDQIADAIVDEYLRRDPMSRINLSVLGSAGMLMIAGKAISKADFDCGELAKSIYRTIGYHDDIEVFVNLETAPEGGTVLLSSRNVLVNGYATRETREGLPRPMVYAHECARRLDELRRNEPKFHWLRPDGEVHIVMEKGEINAVTILAQHAKEISSRDMQTALLESLIRPVFGIEPPRLFINPTGPRLQGGYEAGAGASGRCAAMDFYGGLIPEGGTHLSGKDPQTPERAGAYMARYVARQIIKEGTASSVMIALAYAPGNSEPLMVDIRATGLSSEQQTKLTQDIRQKYDFRTEAIVERLQLCRPLYQASSVYGQFGREGFPWEE